MERAGGLFLALISGVIGLAIVAVVLSRRANTPSVLSAAGGALSSVIGAAVSPISGAGSGSSFGNAGASSPLGQISGYFP